MAAIQQPPGRCLDSKRVRKHLKDDVSLVGAVAVDAKRGDRQRVCSVVRKVEAALGRESRLARIFQANRRRAEQTGNLLATRWLMFQKAGARELFKRFNLRHRHSRSRRVETAR